MSLIDEALRRVQDKEGKGTGSKTIQSPPPVQKQAPDPWRATDRRSSRIGPILLIGLLIVATVSVMMWAWNQQQTRTIAVTAPESTTASTTVLTNETLETQLPAPTPLPRTGSTQSGPWVLNGVVFGSGTPYAVIDGQIVTTGDTYEKWTVASIQRDSVTFENDGGKTRTVYIAP